MVRLLEMAWRVWPYAASFALVVIATGLIALVSADVRVANVSILYLPAVLVAAVRYGRGPAIAASTIAFLLYDVLFVEPRFHLSVADPREWIALLLLLLTAVVTGQLAGDQRRRARIAERREREATLLYDVARLLGDPDLDRAIRDAAERVSAELELAGLAVELDEPAMRRIVVGSESAQSQLRSSDATRAVAPGRAPTARQRGGPVRAVRVVPPQRGRGGASALWSVPIFVAGERAGTLLVLAADRREPRQDEDRTIAAVAAQLGTAMERDRLRREASETEVLRRADEARSALLHAVSHDLRTPLSSIIAGATSLRQRDVAWSDEEREEFLSGIENEARRLDRLVADLLSLSRIESGTLRPSKDRYDIGDLVDDVVGRMRVRDPLRHIRTDVPNDLPPAMLDFVEISQTLTNLLDNAVKYAPEDSEVIVRVRREGSELRFEVSDRGPGVPAEARRRIFEPFERAGREGAPAGTGLGLAVARSFVEAHGGRIWVEPRSDGGSTFAFSVPLAE